MSVVAYFLNPSHLVRSTPVVRGVEYTSNILDAARFESEADALAYVAERGETRRVQVMAVPS